MKAFSAPRLGPGEQVDVMLLLEGTYPFVSGGVSSWVHQIIGGLPDLTFGIVFIGSSPDAYQGLKYTLPPNVRHLEMHYLAEVRPAQTARSSPGTSHFLEASSHMHDLFRSGDRQSYAAILERFVERLCAEPEQHEQEFYFSESSWDELTARYRAGASTLPFGDYFWTVRSMHAPLFMLAKVARALPPARCFHVVSTGYAGVLGVFASKARRVPLVLTEHGIYTKERRIELVGASWVARDPGGGRSDPIGYFRRLWIRFFETLAALTYSAANPIVTLFEGNRQRQVADGADPARTVVVPNGIDLARFGALRARRAEAIPPVAALIGRVVPIKDIKTFVRSMFAVVQTMPGAEGWIVGPATEDERYARECQELVGALGLERSVKFLGLQNVDDILPRVGLVVLTSISEAMPLVLLEGFAAGVPCVTSDVGCARDLVEGGTPEDRALGAAGAVVGIANPQATAAAIQTLLEDPVRWRAAQAAGVRRVAAHYGQPLMLERYARIYAGALRRPWPA